MKNYFLVSSIIILQLLVAPFMLSAQINDNYLTNNGQSSFSIVVPNSSSPVESYSALKLKEYIGKISNVQLDIIKESSVTNKKYIFIGQTNFSTKNLKAAASLAKDEIYIKTLNSNLILRGGDPRGTLNAVYYFLENYLNCRWWTPAEEEIPKKASIILPIIDYNYQPPFEYRDHFTFNTISDANFASTLYENGDDQKLSSQQGGNERILGFAHTFSTILPPSVYFSKHPEWYTDPNNKGVPCTSNSRIPDPQKTQLCLSNEKMYNEFLKNTLKWIKDNPSYNIISVSQNDNTFYCKCDDCQKVTLEEGSPSGPLLRFVNRIAKATGTIYPDKRIETLAYSYSLKAPSKTKPLKNVIIRVAPISANFAYSINSPQNAGVRNNLLNWAKISNNTYYWTYNTNFTNLIFPQPSFDHIGSDLRFLASNNYTGIFIQDNKYTDGFGYFLDLQAWVIGHLIWNPNLNQESLKSEFMSRYYGNGGKYLTQYMNLVSSSFKNSGKALGAFNTDYSFLSQDVFDKGADLFNKSLMAVKDNDVLYKRVMKEKMAFDFARLYFSNPSNNSKRINLMSGSYTQSVDSLFNQISQFKIGRVDRILSNDEYRQKFLARVSSDNVPVNKSIINTNTALRGNKIVIQEGAFQLYKKGTITNIEKDNNASDKLAATIIGISKSWAIQAALNDYSSVVKDKGWIVSAWVSLDIKNPASKFNASSYVNLGIYSNDNKATVSAIRYPLSKLTSNQYLQIQLPALNLSGSDYVWIAVMDASGNLNKLKVDRIELTQTSN